MRLVAIALCSVMFAGSAVAQPGVCNVTIVRAPDEVRSVVEGWVRAEPRCTGTLEVRIVPTDGGYYLFARDATGRVRERVVPDPQSAGVLIASWAADDAAPAPQPRPIEPPSLVAPTPMQDPFVDASPRLRKNHWGGWLTLGLVTSGTATGLRAEGDIYNHGPVTLGVAISALGFDLSVADTQDISGTDVRGIVYVADTFHRGALSLRLGAGAGVMYTTSSTFDSAIGATMDFTDMVEPVAELQVELGADLGTRWSLTAGVVGTLFGQRWIIDSQQVAEARRYGDILALLGVRCRL